MKVSRSQNKDMITLQKPQPSKGTMKQLARKYPHIEIGFGDGKYEINKQTTTRSPAIGRRTLQRHQASKFYNNNDRNITNNNNKEIVDVDNPYDDDYKPNKNTKSKSPKTPKRMARSPRSNVSRSIKKRQIVRTIPLQTKIATVPNTKTIVIIPEPTNTTKRARSAHNNKNDKPGTASSNQAIEVTEQEGAGPRKPSGLSPDKNVFTQELIDTNLMVDNTIVQFLKELCERGRIENPPDDPEKLCKKFVIADLDLNIPSIFS